MFRLVTAVAVSSALALSGQAIAADAVQAELTFVKGVVSVSHAGKITPAKPGVLRAGDRVIAGTGEARLAYADGCVVTLKPRSMATIVESSPCAAGQGLVGAGSASAQFGEMTAGQVLGAFIAIGGLLYGIGSLISNRNNDDTRSVSP